MLALTKRLDGLPLALATAGAYLDQVTISVADYLQLYDTSWRELHESDIGLDSYEDRTLYSTWRISYDRIEQQNELAAKLLRLWCYFSNRDLWYELLSAGPSEEIPWIRELTSSLHVFSQAMRILCNYGFVEGETLLQEDLDSGGYSIHNCVHSWIIHALNSQRDPILARYAVDATARRIPDEDDPKLWITQRRLLQHVDRCVEHVKGQLVMQPDIELALHKFGDLYRYQGKLAEAEEMYPRALQGFEKALGRDHTPTLNTVNNLGNVYRDQGKLVEAEEMYERALQGKGEGARSGSHVNAQDRLQSWPSLQRSRQVGRGRGDVYASAGRVRKGARRGVHVDARHRQQPRQPLRRPRQAGASRGDVLAVAERIQSLAIQPKGSGRTT